MFWEGVAERPRKGHGRGPFFREHCGQWGVFPSESSQQGCDPQSQPPGAPLGEQPFGSRTAACSHTEDC